MMACSCSDDSEEVLSLSDFVLEVTLRRDDGGVELRSLILGNWAGRGRDAA